jgi:hypothetical protein
MEKTVKELEYDIFREEDAFALMAHIITEFHKIPIVDGYYAVGNEFVSAIITQINTNPYLRICVVRKYNSLCKYAKSDMDYIIRACLFKLLEMAKCPYNPIRDHPDNIW